MTIDIKAARDIIAAAKLDGKLTIESLDTESVVTAGGLLLGAFFYGANGLDEERATFLVEAAKGWPAALDEVERLRAQVAELRAWCDETGRYAEERREDGFSYRKVEELLAEVRHILDVEPPK